MRSGQLPLLDYVREMLKYLQFIDAGIQAFLPEADREKRLMNDAEQLMAQSPDPASRPPLYGVLLGVKDLFNVDGLPTQAGSKLPPEAFAGPEATLISRLKQAGALVLGKTVSTEFAYFSPGPTRNPVNPAYSPGGSSSGSAAAVASHMCPIALGTQTIASVIRPAAYCGIYGFKPTQGRMPLEGVFPFSPSIDQLGFFTSSLEDLDYAAPILVDSWKGEQAADADPGQNCSSQEDMKPMIPAAEFLNQADQESLAAFDRCLQKLEEHG
ncbi:MAG TPA: amidase, partial [Candidatus Cloacimonadota bacterium]|nr:amidase [Candidatus Cloacimonadota bacterium]